MINAPQMFIVVIIGNCNYQGERSDSRFHVGRVGIILIIPENQL